MCASRSVLHRVILLQFKQPAGQYDTATTTSAAATDDH